jgi:hypothetical protein
MAETPFVRVKSFVIPDPPPGGSDPKSMLNVKMDPGVRTRMTISNELYWRAH